MKKFYSFLVAAVLLMGATSCQKEATADADAADNVEFVASIAGGRTELGDGNKVMWNDGDKILIFTRENFAGTEFNSDATAATATAKFTTTQSFTISNNGYLAVYPESANTGNATCENGVWSVPVNMQGWNYSPVGYPHIFEKNAFMAAFSGDNSLSFKAATALLKIKNIDNSQAGEIKFSGDKVGGAATLHYDTNNAESPISYTLDTGESDVQYNFPEQNGETIYVPIYPGTVTGFEVYGDDYLNPLVTYNKTITFKAGVIYDLDLDNAPIGGGEEDTRPVSPWQLYDIEMEASVEMRIDGDYHVATLKQSGLFVITDTLMENFFGFAGEVANNQWYKTGVYDEGVTHGPAYLMAYESYPLDVYMTEDAGWFCVVPQMGGELPALPTYEPSPYSLYRMSTETTYPMIIKDGYHVAKNVPATDAGDYVVMDAESNMYSGTVDWAETDTWYPMVSAEDPAIKPLGLYMSADVYVTADLKYIAAVYEGYSLPALPEPEPELLQIKVYNKVGWSEVNCYAWDPSVSGDNWLVSWPGTTMTKEGDWYVYTLDESYRGKNLSFIFNDGTNQTHNLEFVYMDDTRHFRVDAAETADAYETAVAITPENKEAKPGVTIYVKNSANWNPLKIYSWNDSGQPQSDSWSGTQMTQTEVINSVTYYKYAFNNYDNTKGLHVILNNESQQTNNIDVGKFGEPMFINVKGDRNHEVIADPRY